SRTLPTPGSTTSSRSPASRFTSCPAATASTRSRWRVSSRSSSAPVDGLPGLPELLGQALQKLAGPGLPHLDAVGALEERALFVEAELGPARLVAFEQDRAERGRERHALVGHRVAVDDALPFDDVEVVG